LKSRLRWYIGPEKLPSKKKNELVMAIHGGKLPSDAGNKNVMAIRGGKLPSDAGNQLVMVIRGGNLPSNEGKQDCDGIRPCDPDIKSEKVNLQWYIAGYRRWACFRALRC
jgi:hypothetical protein